MAKKEDIVKTKVCSHCGGKLTITQIGENSCFTDHKLVTRDEIVCKHCSRIEWGVPKEVFDLARKLVTEYDYKYYTHLNAKDDGEEYTLEANTGGACHLAQAILSGKFDLKKKL